MVYKRNTRKGISWPESNQLLMLKNNVVLTRINTRNITCDLENVYQSIHTNNNIGFKIFVALLHDA